MDTRVFGVDPMTKITRLWHTDRATGDVKFETKQDVEDILDANKAEFNGHAKQAPWKGEWHKVASIPLSVYWDLQRRGIHPATDPVAFKRWLNDKDNRVFRTRPGRV